MHDQAILRISLSLSLSSFSAVSVSEYCSLRFGDHDWHISFISIYFMVDLSAFCIKLRRFFFILVRNEVIPPRSAPDPLLRGHLRTARFCIFLIFFRSYAVVERSKWELRLNARRYDERMKWSPMDRRLYAGIANACACAGATDNNSHTHPKRNNLIHSHWIAIKQIY